MRRAVLATALVLGGGAGAGLAWLGLGLGLGGSLAPSAEQLAQGAAIYAASCAACHGVHLEGQPDWRSRLPTGRLPVPPHDASGHTWHHPDEVVFRITKEGPAAIVGDGYQSDMPGFGDVLSDEEIRAALDYIKSTWPERERAYQSEVSRPR